MSRSEVLYNEQIFTPLREKDKFREKILKILKKNFDSSLSYQLVYVIDEMVSNIEEHGYRGNRGN
ncbi:MAG: hypothetical protein ABDH37_03155 [Candidatus Hydrothermales bacterium]